MANYLAMNRDELTAEKAALEAKYKEFQAKGLKLNMARGKPGPHQMDLAMDLLKMNDYTTDATIIRVTVDEDTVEGGEAHLEYGAVRKRYKNQVALS